MKFHLRADLTFDAENLEDALAILEDHFGTMHMRALAPGLCDNNPSPLQDAGMRGEVELAPVG